MCIFKNKPLKQIAFQTVMHCIHHFKYSNCELQYITDSLYDFHRSVTLKEKNQCDKAAQGMSDTNSNAA